MSRPIDDIRHSELLFLLSFPARGNVTRGVSGVNPVEWESVRLTQMMYIDMVATLLEELYIRFENNTDQTIIGRLRGELGSEFKQHGVPEDVLTYPREGLPRFLMHGRSQHILRITYRGLRRIEELREVLRHERILEPFGVLLSSQYLNADLESALQRPADMPVSVICADLDGFKRINEKFGHAAGDVVMKAYLEAVREAVGMFGDAYRGVGDETTVVVVGQGHQRTVEIGERILSQVAALRCECKGVALPAVTVSAGVASSPPNVRSMDVLHVAEQRQRLAKERGKSRVVAS